MFNPKEALQKIRSGSNDLKSNDLKIKNHRTKDLRVADLQPGNFTNAIYSHSISDNIANFPLTQNLTDDADKPLFQQNYGKVNGAQNLPQLQAAQQFRVSQLIQSSKSARSGLKKESNKQSFRTDIVQLCALAEKEKQKKNQSLKAHDKLAKMGDAHLKKLSVMANQAGFPPLEIKLSDIDFQE